jgi:dTDP-4-amino-4,6-dideoxygalactose transaminase
MEALVAIAKQHKLPVVEDACQAIGALWRGVPVGGLGDVGCFSFYPTKNLGGFGDGGILTTNRDDLAARLRLLRVHGMEPRYYHHVVGINSRLDSFQAAALNVKLPHLETWTERRRANAARYDALFRESGLARLLALPATAPGCMHVWNQYTIRVPDGRRDALRQYLTQVKVGTEIYYPVPLHRQACFASLSYAEGSLPESERAAREVLSLPIFPELEPAEIATVVYRIAEFFGVRRPQVEPTVRRPHFLGHTAPSQSIVPKVA